MPKPKKQNAPAPAANSAPVTTKTKNAGETPPVQTPASQRHAIARATKTRAPRATVGARPATAGRHVKDVPERPTSTTQPSGTAKRCRRIKPSRRSKKRSHKRKQPKPPSQRSISDALTKAFGDPTNVDAPKSASSATASSTSPVAAIDARPVATAHPPRVRIGEAMRRTGLDEYKVARTFAVVVDKLSGKNPKDSGGVQKLLVDVLKECSRHLDPPHSERDTPSVPSRIMLIHHVPRPDRTPKPPPQLDAAPDVLDVKSQLKEAP